ncbi:hypothetical protein EDD66_11560 [Mobilisporobacter senegalensis]|uniref:Sporulation and spore germination protein n=1 Tax=Mobilisporobacter senegalensis TaxID=1329262 RepID=A0A3N1X6I3_9FIRM|nr:hypothetical protein [Mobilisporobacter senegalensis]ROR22375.1 hypothetical protein EDD66_11560 [Mobilisporobacter senegalensis]
MKKNIKKNIKKNFSYMILCILLTMSLTVFSGCKKDETKTKEETVTEDTGKEADDITPDDTSDEEKEDTESNSTTEETPSVPETKDLLIYGIQNETLQSEQVTVTVPKASEITAEFIVSQVVDVFADNSLEIGIDSVTEEGDKVIVSFMKDKAPLVNVGSGVEITVLDSISMSLLDNLDTCKNVIFRVEGEAYASGHVELDKDEVYKWK